MSTPAYQEIKDHILTRIHAGEWKEGDQVPSENELAREFKVARMTVNRALRELTAEQRYYNHALAKRPYGEWSQAERE